MNDERERRLDVLLKAVQQPCMSSEDDWCMVSLRWLTGVSRALDYAEGRTDILPTGDCASGSIERKEMV